MKFKLLERLYDNQRAGSLTGNLRRKRLSLFVELLAEVPRPAKILDVGGTEVFWKSVVGQIGDVEITILNVTEPEAGSERYRWVVGDACNMALFDDAEFDVVFSNAVIEHVGSLDRQKRMARETIRVGQRLFLEAPHRYFPIEPHFLYPFFQFLPRTLQVWLVWHASLTWRWNSRQDVVDYVRRVRLLSKGELRSMFPGATVVEERFLGMTKSFIVLKGWQNGFSA